MDGNTNLSLIEAVLSRQPIGIRKKDILAELSLVLLRQVEDLIPLLILYQQLSKRRRRKR